MLNGLMALALMVPAATPASQEQPTESAPSTASAPAPARGGKRLGAQRLVSHCNKF